MPTLETAWNGLRHRVGRALGPCAARRTGWFYVVRRGIALRVAAGLEARPTRVPNETVELDEVAVRFPHVTVVPGAPTEEFAGVDLPEPAASDPRTRVLTRPWTARAQSVLEIPGGVAFGPQGWVGIDDHHLLVTGAMTRWNQRTNHIRRECDIHRRERLVHLPGRTADLLQTIVGNYFHFLLQGVPALDAIDRAFGIDQIDRFLVQDTLRPCALEVFERFGIGRDRIEFAPADAPLRYRCESLVATTFPDAGIPGTLSAVAPVRRRFAAELDPAGPLRRWYLTRSDRWTRGVQNEDAVRAMLARRGFEPLVMDDRTVAEQARLVASAEAVVGLHGAALANLVFARPGTRVVELMPGNVRGWNFARLAVAAGLPYDIVMGTEPSLPPRLHRFLVDADMIVDVNLLARRVDAALGS